ncbi:MAG: small ribosomal subunit Rsm22 family protein [Verrucomicrobiales bacterium]|jgi:ribosomal protein RSM22 (predicted rRNA methylase)|nr:small ribosomal subunit Rsm22 family protein [Verrucomicrobiales bacterium]
MNYPQELENWWLTEAGRHLQLRDPKTIAQRLAERAGKLSDAFTIDREERFTDCYADPLTVAAYGNYFFPQTYARTNFVISELLNFRHWTPPQDRPLRILDLGGGTGAALIAGVDLLSEKFPHCQFHTTLVDQSETALKLYRHLTRDQRKRHLFKSSAVRASLTESAHWNIREPQDLILVSFSLGEAFYQQEDSVVQAWLGQLLDKLTPNGLLVILEPALKETSERLERLRDFVVSESPRNWHIWGPCLHEKNCPLLAGKKHWCHEVRNWQIPPTINRINDRLRRSVWDLKFSFLALGKTPPPNATDINGDPRHVRLLTPVVSGHGKLLLSGCNANGEHAEYDILKRHLDKPQARQLETLKRGDIVTFNALEKLGGKNQYRLTDSGFSVR